MKIMRVNNHETLAEYMMGEALEGANVTAALFYNDAVALMRELMTYDEITPVSIEIAGVEWTNYDKEYYVAVLGGDYMELYVRPAFADGKYMKDEPDIMLVDAEANCRIIQEIPAAQCFEVYIGEHEEDECGDCCGDCCDCEHSRDIITQVDKEVLEYLYWRLLGD